MIVEPELLAYRGTREPSFVQIGRFCELRFGHPTGSTDALLGEDACDRGAGKSEVTSHAPNVANSEIAINERLCFIGAELAGAP